MDLMATLRNRYDFLYVSKFEKNLRISLAH